MELGQLSEGLRFSEYIFIGVTSAIALYGLYRGGKRFVRGFESFVEWGEEACKDENYKRVARGWREQNKS